MITTDAVVIGGGPAGLTAAYELASHGAKVLLLERRDKLGGQLVKQTHMFFGSEKQYAGKRGIDICDILINNLTTLSNVTVMTDCTVLGLYEDGVLTAEYNDKYVKIKPRAMIVATGASEKFLAFAGNDLPGIYGAGAVQTLMNVYGVKPADNVVMVGAGNIGLIVSYQLMQAGVNVRAVIDAAPQIGGYLVHASKLARLGIPILTGHTVKRALGDQKLEGVEIVALDDKWQQVEGSEQYIECDNLCISVGLSPLTELMYQIGCQMVFAPTLGGFVPKRNSLNQTTVPYVFTAGDASGVEEASSAMVGGHIAGLGAVCYLGLQTENTSKQIEDYKAQASTLRSGETGNKIRQGLELALIRE